VPPRRRGSLRCAASAVLLEVKGLRATVAATGQEILQGVDLTVREGEARTLCPHVVARRRCVLIWLPSKPIPSFCSVCRSSFLQSSKVDDFAVERSAQMYSANNKTSLRVQTHAIMGTNGSGKSTLSKCLVGHPDYTVTAGTGAHSSCCTRNLSASLCACGMAGQPACCLTISGLPSILCASPVECAPCQAWRCRLVPPKERRRWPAQLCTRARTSWTWSPKTERAPACS
jgi:hypothetical protein